MKQEPLGGTNDPNPAPSDGEDDRYLKNDVMDVIEGVEKLYERSGTIPGLPTGFARLDRLIGGLLPTQVCVIASRPSMGKSALALNIAGHVALDLHKPVGIFNLETDRFQLVQRLLCSRAKVNLQKLRDGFLSAKEFQSLMLAASTIAECPIRLDDTTRLTIADLCAKAREMHAQEAAAGGLALLVIDYLQLVRSESKRAGENRYVEVSEINAEIKALAKELNIPVIVLSQLNRNPETRVGGRPSLSDLRDAGSIEDDADLVLLLVRPEYYAMDEEERDALCGQAELIVAKQRNGPVGVVELTFLKEFTRFEDRTATPAA